MPEQRPHPPEELPPDTRGYLAHRLDGARDLYLLALALGERNDGFAPFRTESSARPAFTSRQSLKKRGSRGSTRSTIAVMLGKPNIVLADSIRPDLWARVEQLLAEAAGKRAERRNTR